MNRHKEFDEAKVQERLGNNYKKLWSLNALETTSGKLYLVGHDKKRGEFVS